VEKKIEHEYVKVEQQKQALAQREGPSRTSLSLHPQYPSHTCGMCACAMCACAVVRAPCRVLRVRWCVCVRVGGYRGGQYREAEAVGADSGVPEEGGTA
jgi:hypothetical protein